MQTYPSLESRVFDSYLIQSVPEFAPDPADRVPEQAQLELYRWTRALYTMLAAEPGLLAKTINPDDAHQNPFCCSAYGKPALKPAMRKDQKLVNDLLRYVWEMVLSDESAPGDVRLRAPFEVRSKYSALLERSGIVIGRAGPCAPGFPGLFQALAGLAVHADGFDRFVRCAYDPGSPASVHTFRRLVGDTQAYDRLAAWLTERRYRAEVDLNFHGVKNYESIRVSFSKNTDGGSTPLGSMYEHEHIGVYFTYNVLWQEPVMATLLVQDVRRTLGEFDALPEGLRQFITTYHARCTGCGYCTQRSRGRHAHVKPYTVAVDYLGKHYALCPINQVFSFCWSVLDGALVAGMIAYLEHLERVYQV